MWAEIWNKYEQQQIQVEQRETSLEQKLDFLSNATWNKRDFTSSTSPEVEFILKLK